MQMPVQIDVASACVAWISFALFALCWIALAGGLVWYWRWRRKLLSTDTTGAFAATNRYLLRALKDPVDHGVDAQLQQQQRQQESKQEEKEDDDDEAAAAAVSTHKQWPLDSWRVGTRNPDAMFADWNAILVVEHVDTGHVYNCAPLQISSPFVGDVVDCIHAHHCHQTRLTSASSSGAKVPSSPAPQDPAHLSRLFRNFNRTVVAWGFVLCLVAQAFFVSMLSAVGVGVATRVKEATVVVVDIEAATTPVYFAADINLFGTTDDKQAYAAQTDLVWWIRHVNFALLLGETTAVIVLCAYGWRAWPYSVFVVLLLGSLCPAALVGTASAVGGWIGALCFLAFLVIVLVSNLMLYMFINHRLFGKLEKSCAKLYGKNYNGGATTTSLHLNSAFEWINTFLRFQWYIVGFYALVSALGADGVDVFRALTHWNFVGFFLRSLLELGLVFTAVIVVILVTLHVDCAVAQCVLATFGIETQSRASENMPEWDWFKLQHADNGGVANVSKTTTLTTANDSDKRSSSGGGGGGGNITGSHPAQTAAIFQPARLLRTVDARAVTIAPVPNTGKGVNQESGTTTSANARSRKGRVVRTADAAAGTAVPVSASAVTTTTELPATDSALSPVSPQSILSVVPVHHTRQQQQQQQHPPAPPLPLPGSRTKTPSMFLVPPPGN